MPNILSTLLSISLGVSIKFTEFLKNHKKEIMYTAAGVVIFKIGYNVGWHDYKKVTNSVFNTMQKHGYNTVKLIEPGVLRASRR